MMELILAGNGASLSNRFLIKLAKLAELHDFNIIVDEIMTGGRVPMHWGAEDKQYKQRIHAEDRNNSHKTHGVNNHSYLQ